MATITYIPSPEAFFQSVIQLQTKLEVHQAVNKLLEDMKAKWKESTISKELSAYRKLFYGYVSPVDDLNEVVTVKGESKTQHIAAMLLTLSTDQTEVIARQRQDNENKRAGFNEDGTLKQVETKPLIDMQAIINQAEKLIKSSKIEHIMFGIALVTGLRANEVLMHVRNYDDEKIEREMIQTAPFLIGFKGLSKKRGDERFDYFVRPTLIAAKRVVEAQNKLYKLVDAKGFNGDYEDCRRSIIANLARDFKKQFPQLATLAAYDEDGKLTNNDATSHRARAFYACTLRAVLKDVLDYNDSAAKKYIKECIGHDSVGITSGYLDKFDESEFINTPKNLMLPESIKHVGMQVAGIDIEIEDLPIKVIVKEEKTIKSDFSINQFLSILSNDLQLEFGELLNKHNGNIALAIGMLLSNQQKQIEALEAKIEAQNEAIQELNAMKDAKVKVKEVKVKPPKKSEIVEDAITKIFQAIGEYNNQQLEPKQFIIPSLGFVNEVYQKVTKQYLGYKTYKAYADKLLPGFIDNLQLQGLTLEYANDYGLNGNYEEIIEKWNGKFHRKNKDANVHIIFDIVKNLND